MMFQDDDARNPAGSHCERVFREHEMVQPPQISDLNNIENVWDVLEKDLHSGHTAQDLD